MKFGFLYEIEVARPWTETSVADCFWEALERVKVAEEVRFTHVFSGTKTIRIGHGVHPALHRPGTGRSRGALSR